MAVATEIASMLDALDVPAMLIRPQDMTVAAVNEAFAQTYGRFRFEGRCCWEALHRAQPCPKSGLACPLAQAQSLGVGVCTATQTVYGSARVVESTVTVRPVLTADGSPLYWLEVIRTKSDAKEPFRRGTVGVSSAHNTLMKRLEKIAAVDEPYVLVGEAGLGKELYARTVHENSVRASCPFVVVAAERLTEQQAQSLLCGDGVEPGLFERADGGTLYVDNVQRTAPAALKLLLRMEQTGAYTNHEGKRKTVSLRIAGGATKGEEEAVSEEWAKLLFPTNRIVVTPLRERRKDIAALAKFFVNGIVPVNSRTITKEALECLRRYDWPGNVRELKEVVLKAAERAGGSTVTSASLALSEHRTASFMAADGEICPLAEIKDRYLLWAVDNFEGPRSELAAKLGVSERTLYRLYAQSKAHGKKLKTD